MKELIPIKVKIGLRSNGHADHPNWTLMSMINTDKEVRNYCPSGWIYDKSSGHEEDTPHSPRGMQWGCLLCTRPFVIQAKQIFPEIVVEMTETEFEDFFNNKARIHMSDNDYDIKTLQGLESELNLKKELNQDTTALKDKITKAIDPEDNENGIKKNEDRYWADYKLKNGFTIKK